MVRQAYASARARPNGTPTGKTKSPANRAGLPLIRLSGGLSGGLGRAGCAGRAGRAVDCPAAADRAADWDSGSGSFAILPTLVRRHRCSPTQVETTPRLDVSFPMRRTHGTLGADASSAARPSPQSGYIVAERLRQQPVDPPLRSLAKYRQADAHGLLAGRRLGAIGAEQAIPPRQIEPEIAVGLLARDRMMHLMHLRGD